LPGHKIITSIQEQDEGKVGCREIKGQPLLK